MPELFLGRKMKKYIMSLDQGTTSSRCIIFDIHGNNVCRVSHEFEQIFPKEGWVEHNPFDIWSSQMSAACEALLKIGGKWNDIYSIGITNQRETTIVWDRKTGIPVYNAIVWQCRRTAAYCDELNSRGLSNIIREKTGLFPDSYFSATKLKWILDNVPGTRERATDGELCFGTVDSWLIYNLTAGRLHATDSSNASRTMLYNINTHDWDDDLLALFDIPRCMMPKVCDSVSLFGYTDENVLGGAIPIGGVAGDQQAALFGQLCFERGQVKNTYGTGGFLLMNTGDKPYFLDDGLLTTVAWSINGKTTYAKEGSVFVSGAAIQWLRDGLRIIASAKESETEARKVENSGGVYVVPAFTGLGAPYWDPYARGIIIGITRATEREHIIRATIESMAYQSADVILQMEKGTGIKINKLKVDGGACANNLLLEFQSDLLGCDICRPKCIETTALGVAYMSGITCGIYSGLAELSEMSQADCIFTPKISESERKVLLENWHKAVSRSLKWS